MSARAPVAAARALGGNTVRRLRARRGPKLSRALPLQELANDSGVALVSYVLSDYVAQVGELRQPTCDEWDEFCVEPEERGKVSAKRLRRFATFGAFDGVLSHYWYRWLDDAADAWPTFGEISEMGRSSGVAGLVEFQPLAAAPVDANAVTDGGVSRVVEMVAADLIVFSPWWCALFLGAMAAMTHFESDAAPSARGAGKAAARRLRSSWKTLYLGDFIAWIPLNGILYGLVPVDNRVQAFGVINLLYTVVLSFWAERTRRAERLADAGVSVEAFDAFGSNILPVARPKKPPGDQPKDEAEGIADRVGSEE